MISLKVSELRSCELCLLVLLQFCSTHVYRYFDFEFFFFFLNIYIYTYILVLSCTISFRKQEVCPRLSPVVEGKLLSQE